MSRLLRFVFRGLIVVVALVGAVGVLFGYFVYSPAPEDPRLSGTLIQGIIEVGGRTRTYLTYVPLGLTKRARLSWVMHGSGPPDFTSSESSGATNPKLRWNSLPFTAAGMAFLSLTGAIRDY